MIIPDQKDGSHGISWWWPIQFGAIFALMLIGTVLLTLTGIMVGGAAFLVASWEFKLERE